MTGTIRRRCCGTRCSRAARRSWRALSGDSRRRAEGGVASPCWWASRGSGRRGRWRNLRDGAGAGGAGAVGAVLRGRGGAAVRAVRGGARGIRAGGGGRDAARRTRGEWAAARAAGAGASRAYTGPSRARRPSARRGAHAAHRRRHSVPARAGGADADGAGARRPHWADAGTVALLRHVARFAPRGRLLVVGAYRDVEVGRAHPLADVLGVLPLETTYDQLALTGLEPEAVQEILEAVGR